MMSQKIRVKVLVIDKVNNILIEKLSKSGAIVDYQPDIKAEEIANIISKFQGLVLRSKIKVDKALIDSSNNLKFIARAGSGMESIDIDYAGKKNIVCLNSPEGNCNSVGEHALGMLLSLFHRINFSYIQVTNYIWERQQNRGVELEGKTVGIIGYGHTGNAFARKLSGMNVRVLAYDKYKQGFSDHLVKECTLETLLSESDIISFHVPYSSETHYYLDEGFIDRAKKPFYLVNTSRGSVVNTKEVLDGIYSGKLLGACLDVLEYEDSAFDKTGIEKENSVLKELIRSEKVVITPHIAGLSVESDYKISSVLADKIINEIKFL